MYCSRVFLYIVVLWWQPPHRSPNSFSRTAPCCWSDTRYCSLIIAHMCNSFNMPLSATQFIPSPPRPSEWKPLNEKTIDNSEKQPLSEAFFRSVFFRHGFSVIVIHRRVNFGLSIANRKKRKRDSESEWKMLFILASFHHFYYKRLIYWSWFKREIKQVAFNIAALSPNMVLASSMCEFARKMSSMKYVDSCGTRITVHTHTHKWWMV